MTKTQKLLDTIPDNDAIIRCHWSLTKDSIKALKKEILAEKAVKENYIFCEFYAERANKIEDTQKQLSGIDYETFTHKIDLKASVGDYRDDNLYMFECVPVEIYQNGKRTFTTEKATTDILFVNFNVETNKIYFLSVPYKWIVKIVDANLNNDAFNRFTMRDFIAPFRTSDNGSGTYIKVPMKNFIGLDGVYYKEVQLKNIKTN